MARETISTRMSVDFLMLSLRRWYPLVRLSIPARIGARRFSSLAELSIDSIMGIKLLPSDHPKVSIRNPRT
jgi:hypothetical protein